MLTRSFRFSLVVSSVLLLLLSGVKAAQAGPCSIVDPAYNAERGWAPTVARPTSSMLDRVVWKPWAYLCLFNIHYMEESPSYPLVDHGYWDIAPNRPYNSYQGGYQAPYFDTDPSLFATCTDLNGEAWVNYLNERWNPSDSYELISAVMEGPHDWIGYFASADPLDPDVSGSTCYAQLEWSNVLTVSHWNVYVGDAGNIEDANEGSLLARREPLAPSDPVPRQNTGAPSCPAGVGNPIHSGTGNKYLHEVDYEFGHLSVARHYNSDYLGNRAGLGAKWRLGYSALTFERLPDNYQNTPSLVENGTVEMVRPDGKHVFWRISDGIAYQMRDDTGGVLGFDSDELGAITGYTYRTAGATEIYDEVGKLVAIDFDDGDALTITYVGDVIDRVTNSRGYFVEYLYDGNGQVVSVNINDSGSIGYEYDTVGNLWLVHYQDGSVREYHYEDVLFPQHLTGLSDEEGRRVRTWAYDAQGRGILSTHGDATSTIERYELTYNPDGTTTVVNPEGSSRTHQFEVHYGRVQFAASDDLCSDCGGADLRGIAYDVHGFRDLVVDGNGNSTDYDYDANGLLTQVTYAAGTVDESTQTTIWDVDRRVPLSVSSEGQTTSYTYNERGQVLTEIVRDEVSGNERTTRYSYYESPASLLGKLHSVDGPRLDVADVTTYSYYTDTTVDHHAGDLARVENALGHGTDFLRYDGHGRVLESRDANGVLTSYVYDARGRPLEKMVGSRSEIWTWDGSGRMTAHTSPTGRSTTVEYDTLGRVMAFVTGSNERTEYSYDAAGNRVGVVYKDGLGSVVYSETRTFDSLGRVASVVSGDGVTTTFSYDRAGNEILRQRGARTTSYEYDARGRMIRDIDGNGSDTLRSFDAHGHLLAFTDKNGNTTSYSYDGFGNQVSLTSPDTGVARYTHDAAGNVITETDARDVTIGYEYDALSRITRVSYPDRSLEVLYGYDDGTYGRGRLTSMSDSSGTTTFAYDAHGNLVRETRDDGQASYTTTYGRGSAGELTSLTYPSGAAVTFQRDSQGDITEVVATAEGVAHVVASGVARSPVGGVERLTFGNGLSRDVTHTLGGRVASIADGNVFDLRYQLNAEGVVEGITDAVFGDHRNFLYDAVGRLSDEQGPLGTIRYDHDANGNRVQEGNVSYTYEAASNRLTAVGAFGVSHDNAGHRSLFVDSNGSGSAYVYDEGGRLTEIAERTVILSGKGKNKTLTPVETPIASYGYDGRGRRAYKSVEQGAISFIYDSQSRLLGEYSNDGSPLREYIYLYGSPVAMIAHAAPLGPPPPGQELVVDQDDAQVVGSWSRETRGKNYDGDHLLGNGAGSVRWTVPGLIGRYEVHAWWVSNRKYATEVPYTIAHSGLTSVETRSHANDGGTWTLLGVYDFDGQGAEWVDVDASGGLTTADAILFREIPEPTAPETAELVFLHTDRQGAPRVASDATGKVLWRWQSDAFGKGLADDDVDGDGAILEVGIRFPGQYFDAESSFHYNGLRDYDPATGRYLESDPIGLAGGSNTYNYAYADPANYSDPTGLDPTIAIGADAHGLLGGGVVLVTCVDECDERRAMLYVKKCAGARVNVGASLGVIMGMEGAQCREETYSGDFLEGEVGGIGCGPGLAGATDGSSVHEIDLTLGCSLKPGIQAGHCTYYPIDMPQLPVPDLPDDPRDLWEFWMRLFGLPPAINIGTPDP